MKKTETKEKQQQPKENYLTMILAALNMINTNTSAEAARQKSSKLYNS